MEAWLKTIEVDCERCLDIGGSGYPISTPGRLKSFKAKEYKILDNNAEKPYKNKDWSKPDIVCDIQDDLGINNRWMSGYFDVIFMLEVAEYLYNPLAAFRNIFQLLGGGGVVYSSFPFIYPHHRPIALDCLRYTEQGVITLLERAGFKKVKIIPRVATKGQEDLLKFWKSEGYHCATNSTHTGYLVEAHKP